MFSNGVYKCFGNRYNKTGDVVMSKLCIRDEAVAFGNLGRDIKEARKTMRLSRAALAEILNIDMRYLANIENYGRMPSLTLFYRLVTVCNLSVERYFYGELKMEDDELQSLFRRICSCPKHYRIVIKSVIEGLEQVKE